MNKNVRKYGRGPSRRSRTKMTATWIRNSLFFVRHVLGLEEKTNELGSRSSTAPASLQLRRYGVRADKNQSGSGQQLLFTLQSVDTLQFRPKYTRYTCRLCSYFFVVSMRLGSVTIGRTCVNFLEICKLEHLPLHLEGIVPSRRNVHNSHSCWNNLIMTKSVLCRRQSGCSA